MNNIKDYRKDELRAYVIGNILVALLLHGWVTPEAIKEETLTVLVSSAVISSVIYIYVFILDSVVPASWKDNLVYAFIGRPGDTVFTDIRSGDLDARFTKEEAVEKYADVYSEIDSKSTEKEKHKIENSTWYSIYQKYEDKGTVFISQRDFLLNRDMSFITLDIMAAYVAFSVLFGEINVRRDFLIVLVIEFVLTNLAARWRAKKFVLNVIAADIHKR